MNETHPAIKKTLLALGCLLTFSFGMVGVDVLTTRDASVQATDVFDFKQVLDLESGIGPKEGDRIDLNNLEGRDGKKIADAADSKPIILAVVKSDCGMCRIAKDAMSYIRTEVEQVGVKYYLAALNPPSPESGFRFTDSLGIDAPSFLWRGDAKSVPEVIPYHLLLDSTGTIIKRWPGSNQDKLIRERMAKQIVIDTLKAVAP